MDERDHYRTISRPAETEIRIERSRFIAHAFHATSEDDFSAALTVLRKDAFDATHHCWAYRLFGDGAPRARSSDAGEPSGTAGRPILQAIESAALFDTGVVVVRYFGGVKLGTGGLGRAYRDAAQEVLRAVGVEERFLYEPVSVEVPYGAMSIAYRFIAPPDVLLDREDFGEPNVFTFRVRRSRVEAFAAELIEKRLRRI